MSGQSILIKRIKVIYFFFQVKRIEGKLAVNKNNYKLKKIINIFFKKN